MKEVLDVIVAAAEARDTAFAIEATTLLNDALNGMYEWGSNAEERAPIEAAVDKLYAFIESRKG